MRWKQALDASAERLVALARLVFALAASVTLSIEPIGTFRNQQTLLALVGVYLAYAVVAAFVSPTFHLRVPEYRLISHGIDTLAALGLIWASGDVATPFRVFGTFAILAAGLRFGWRAILITVLLVAAMFVSVALYTGGFLRDPTFRLIHLAIGLSFYAVLAAVLSHLKNREEKVRADLDRLASWPRAPLGETSQLMRDLLANTALVLRARQVVMIWEEAEEPWIHLATWSDGAFALRREPPDRFEPLVAPALKDASFFTRNLRHERPVVVVRREAGIGTWRGQPVHGGLLEILPGANLLSVCVEGESMEGRLFITAASPPDGDALLTAELVADLVASRLDQAHAIAVIQESAVSEERLRLARDLHDGLLQSLTGVALHLKSAQKLIRSEPDAAMRSVRDLQDVILADQRGLRHLIHQLRPFPRRVDVVRRLTGRLEDLGSRFQNQFGIDVRLRAESLSTMVSESLRHEIFSIINEALANAAKHASAQSVDVAVSNDGEQVRIVVSDDGKGFSFRGRYDLAQLTTLRIGPVTLKERIASLGGSLVIDSTETGSTLDIRISAREELNG